LDKIQKSITYLVSFVVLLFILKILGILRIDGEQIIGYTFIFYGISTVYLSFGQNEKWALILGTVFFSLGILLFMVNNFYFPNVTKLIFPSIILTLSLSSFMLYLDGNGEKFYLYSSIVLLFVTLLTAVIWGVLSFKTFWNSVQATVINYWPIVLIFLLVMFLLRDRDF
jgi:hypothetical protein